MIQENGFKRCREGAQLTQIEVAKRLNVRQSTVSMWEQGASIPRGITLIQLAKLYHCSTDDLLSAS